MSNATFHNFTDKPFTGYWNGKAKTFKAGERLYMPAYLAAHFAKHLTNQVLIETVQGGENYTSPKFPDQVPQYMQIFRKAYIADAVEEGNELDQEIASVHPKAPSADINVVQPKQMTNGSGAAAEIVEAGPGTEAQIVPVPADDDEFDHSGSK